MVDFHNPLKGLSKPETYAVIAGTAGLGGYLVYSHHKKTGTWNVFSGGSSTANGTQINPVTGMAYSQDNAIDPITNESYLAEAQQYGSVQAAESSVSGYGQSSNTGSGYGVQPAVGGQDGTSNPAAGSVGSATYTSDAAWVQAATAGLAGIQFPETDVASALGAYINGQQLTPAQANLVRIARAEFGNPPGNEPVILAPVTQPGNTGSGPAGPPSISAGHVVSADGNDATVAWTGTNAVRYDTVISGAGKINGQRATVSEPQAVYSGLEPGHVYTVTITPYNASGKAGASGHIDLKTPPVATKKLFQVAADRFAVLRLAYMRLTIS